MPSSLHEQTPLPKLKRKFPPEAEVDDWGLTTAQQDAKVEELRRILVARGAWKPSFDFHTLLRFLRAREYEVDKALSMFLDHLQWRQENRVDHILHEFDFKEREEFLSIYPQGYHKTDKKVKHVAFVGVGIWCAGTSNLYSAFGKGRHATDSSGVYG